MKHHNIKNKDDNDDNNNDDDDDGDDINHDNDGNSMPAVITIRVITIIIM